MTDTYLYLIREPDWNSDEVLTGTMGPELQEAMGAHGAFAEAVAKLGAKIVGGEALQSAKYGGMVKRGDGDQAVEQAVYTDSAYADSSELVTGFYLVETEDEEQARHIAALVPSAGIVEWRKVMPMPNG